MSEHVGQTASRRDAGECYFKKGRERAEGKRSISEEGGEPESRAPWRQEAGVSGEEECVL